MSIKFSGKLIQLFDKKFFDLDTAIEKSYQEIATATKDYMVEQFDKASDAGPNGSSNDLGNWVPLQESTKKYKDKHGNFGRAPLKTSGKMYEALKNCDKNWIRTSKGIKIQIESDYAKWQNEGNDRGTPARPFFITDSTNTKAMEELQQKLKPIIDEAFKNHINNG